MQLPNDTLTGLFERVAVRTSENEERQALISGVTAEQGMAIYSLIKETRSKRTLEIGLGYGVSALFACQAHADSGIGGLHTAMDPLQTEDFKGAGCLNVERADLRKHFRFFEESSFAVLPRLLAKGERFDFIFIDGMHVFDYTLVDFFFSDMLLESQGYLMVDDLWMPSVRYCVRYILSNRHYQLCPRWIWNPKPLAVRAWRSLFNRKLMKLKSSITLEHQLRRPFDWSAIHFALKGSLKYQVLQKKSDDDRNWYHHRAF